MNPWDVCIVRNQKGCNSSVRKSTRIQMYKGFATALLSNGDPYSSQDIIDELSEEEDDAALRQELELCIVFKKSRRGDGNISTRYQFDSSWGSFSYRFQNYILSRLSIITGSKSCQREKSRARDGDQIKKDEQNRYISRKLGQVVFNFHFGGPEYSGMLSIVPRQTVLIILHKDHDNIGLNY